MKYKLSVCILAVLSNWYALALKAEIKTAAPPWHLSRFISQNKSVTAVQISGTITSETGEPLADVTIVNKGTRLGTTSKADGTFSLSVPDTRGTLIFSLIGYTTQEVTYNGNTANVNIKLSPDSKALDDVIVIGYGTQKKSDVTGAISSISGKDLSQTPAGSAMEQAQGRLAGVDIVRSNGSPGSPMQIRIRGNRSINAGNDPLYVIDGIPTNTSINDFNPNDIESMEVLKDASAVAIYGSRGANGVILITTKKGKEGKAIISYDGYYGIKEPVENIDLMNAQEFARYVRTAFGRSPDDNSMDATILSAQEVLNMQNGKETDWLGSIFQTGVQQDHQLSVSGGTKDIKYYLSGSHFDEQGVLPATDYSRTSLRVNIEARLSDRLKLGISSTISSDERNIMRDQVYNNALLFAPSVSAYDDNGNLIPYPSQRMGNTSNPLIYLQPNQYTNERRGYRVFANIFADYSIFKDLTYRINFGPDIKSARLGIYTGSLDQNVTTATVNNQNDFAYTIENILNYKKQFGKHAIDVVGLFSTQESRSEFSEAGARDIPVETSAFYDLGSAGTLASMKSGLSEWGLLSYMGRINYQFKDRYLVTVTGRADGSSRLATGRKWGFFPSVAVGWVLSEEEFLRSSSVPYLKLRVGYGEVGNTSIDPYQTLGGLTRTIYAFGDNQAFGYGQSIISNPDLGWEISKTINIGMDFGLFNNRVTGSLEFYNTNTSDLLLNRLIPITSGYNSILQNIGATRNRGIEFSASTFVIDNTDGFRWNVNLNLFTNKEEIRELFDGQNDDVGNQWFIGEPIDLFYSFKQIGIWQTKEAEEAKRYNQAPGDIKIADVNGRDAAGNLTKQPDGKINADDRTVLGSTVPKWSGGITNRFSYKGLEFSFLVQARQGQMLNSDFHFLGGNGWQGRTNILNLNYWTPNNPSNEIPIPKSNTAPLYFDAVRYFDGSFIKVRNISLGYNFNSNLIRHLRLSSLRLYATANNAITFSKYKVVDPETSAGNVGGTIPLNTSTYVIGLGIKF